MRNKLIAAFTFLISMPAFAEDMAAQAAADNGSGLALIGAGLAIGIAALGGGIGQGLIGKSAMDGISRNPQAAKPMFVPMILGLVLIESLVIYAFVISFLMQGKF